MNEPKRKVYIPNLAGHDYTQAKKFGWLVSCTEGNVNPMQVDRLLYSIQEIMSKSDAEDFICLSGHQAICTLVAMVMLHKYGKVNLLIYDGKKKDYVPRTITSAQLENDAYLPSASQDTGKAVSSV